MSVILPWVREELHKISILRVLYKSERSIRVCCITTKHELEENLSKLHLKILSCHFQLIVVPRMYANLFRISKARNQGVDHAFPVMTYVSVDNRCKVGTQLCLWHPRTAFAYANAQTTVLSGANTTTTSSQLSGNERADRLSRTADITSGL